MEVPHLCFGLVAPPVGNHQTPRSDRTQQANLLSLLSTTQLLRGLCASETPSLLVEKEQVYLFPLLFWFNLGSIISQPLL